MIISVSSSKYGQSEMEAMFVVHCRGWVVSESYCELIFCSVNYFFVFFSFGRLLHFNNFSLRNKTISNNALLFSPP